MNRTIDSSIRPRDHRIDFWRGLCLIDMFLVHLVYQGMLFGDGLSLLLGEYTRFAAGGFIFIVGLSVGAILLPKAMRDAASRGRVYGSLYRRAGLLLVVHYLLEFGCLLLYPSLVGMVVDSYPQAAWEILVLRRGSGLLMFYVAMLLVAPLLIEAIRQGYAACVLLGSVALFAWGQAGENAWRLALPIQQEFLVVLWQVIFVAGLFAGRALPRYDGLRTPVKVLSAALLVAAAAVLWINCYAPDFGREPWLPLVFWKTPLSTGEALKYLAGVGSIVVLTDLCWRWLRDTGLTALATRLGRNSLLVYVAHVWVVIFMVRLSGVLGWTGAINLAVTALGLGILWAIARHAEQPLELPAVRGVLARLSRVLAVDRVRLPQVRPAYAWVVAVGLLGTMIVADSVFRATPPTDEFALTIPMTDEPLQAFFGDEPTDPTEPFDPFVEELLHGSPDDEVEFGPSTGAGALA